MQVVSVFRLNGIVRGEREPEGDGLVAIRRAARLHECSDTKNSSGESTNRATRPIPFLCSSRRTSSFARVSWRTCS